MSEPTETEVMLLVERAEALGIKIPSVQTLKKYGLETYEWLQILQDQGWVCPIMGTVPSSGRFVTDHEHAKGWAKMPPGERKRYVRGITSWYANHAYLGRGISVERAENVVRYLKAYEERRP